MLNFIFGKGKDEPLKHETVLKEFSELIVSFIIAHPEVPSELFLETIRINYDMLNIHLKHHVKTVTNNPDALKDLLAKIHLWKGQKKLNIPEEIIGEILKMGTDLILIDGRIKLKKGMTVRLWPTHKLFNIFKNRKFFSDDDVRMRIAQKIGGKEGTIDSIEEKYENDYFFFRLLDDEDKNGYSIPVQSIHLILVDTKRI